MPVKLTQSSRWMKLCGPFAASLILFAPGCGHDHSSSSGTVTSAASDSSTYHSYDAPPPVMYQPSSAPTTAYQPSSAPPVATYAPQTDGLRGPRPQAELDAIYSSSQVRPLPPTPAPRPIQLQRLPENIVVNAPNEPGWNVPITREWKHIVIHHSASSAGNAASFDRTHREKNGWDGLGYHFVIGNGNGSGDGQVEVGYRWTKQMQGAHAGNYEYNQHGIGICLVGDFEHGGPPSAAQLASLRALVVFLQAKASIPPTQIIGHGNVPGKNTECPGRHMDVLAFRNSIGGAYLQRSSAPVSTVEKPIVNQPTIANSAPAKPYLVKAVATP